MKDINLNGQWKVYFSEDKDIDISNYIIAEEKQINVPKPIEKVMKDRRFSGPYFYEKELYMEEIDSENSYILEFSGVSYYCEIYLNGKYVDEHEGIWDAFQVDITKHIKAGGNKLVIKVIKPDFNKESKYHFRSVLFGFIPDIMIPFGGIWKDVNLLIRGKNYFKDIEYKFDSKEKSIVIDSKLNNIEDLKIKAKITTPSGEIIEKTLSYLEEMILTLEHIDLWSPNTPNLYTLKIELWNNELLDAKEIKAGFRKIDINQGEIYLNNEKFYMRGVLHWGSYPEKFVPLPSYEEVRSELMKIKALGFNTVKHCLYFPPKYYYELCDELGIVTWQELPLWLPRDNGYILDRIDEQYPKMLKYFMHYPTISLVSLGCELDATISSGTLNKLYDLVREKDESMIICDNSGSGECFEGVTNSQSDIYDYHFYAELYNLEGLVNEFTRSYRFVRPWIFGEYNDSDTFRLVKDIEKSSNYELWWLNDQEEKNLLRMSHKGFNSDLPIYNQKKILKEYGVEEEVEDIKEMSLKQSYMIRKYVLELTRTYKEIKGYNITAIRDVPITTSGIFDDNMNSKFDEKEFTKINGEVVVAFTKNLTRIWHNGADRFLNEDLYNYFSESNLKGRLVVSNRKNEALNGKYKVSIKDGNKIYFSFEDDFTTDKDDVKELAQLNLKLPQVEEAKHLELVVELTYGEETYENHWDIWVYDKDFSKKLIYIFDNTNSLEGVEETFKVKRICSMEELHQLTQGDILITTYFDKDIEGLTDKGVNILYYQKSEGYFPLTYNPFYREGVKRIFNHKITDSIDHLDFVGYQFYGLGVDKYYDKLQLKKLIGEYTPIIRRYDARSFKAGDYMFEYSKNKGKIIVTTLNFDGGKGSQPYNFKYNNFAKYMLNSIINYLS